MADVRLSIVYYSTYGTNHAMAQVAAETAKEAGAEVRLRRVAETVPASVVQSVPAWAEQARKMENIPVATSDDLVWANAFLFSAPTRFGTMASQMRAFIDTLGGVWQAGKLANKAASGMTSSQTLHGGQEFTLIGLYTTFSHWGSILVPPGYTDEAIFNAGGNPYGTSTLAVTPGSALSPETRAAIVHQTKRLVHFAAKIAD